jgi:septal ring-binding cell division protein DamX
MNLADYLSELLVQHDEVSVPGLGYFMRVRMNAHYNEKEAKFYPPYHRVKFVPQIKDDETFAQYVAQKKNISLASSKYFIEKFIVKVKDDASRGSYLFSGLGSFNVNQDQLIFVPNDKITDDPSFYGYEPVNINKAERPLLTEPVKPVFTEPVKPVFAESAPSPVITAEPAKIAIQEQYFEEEEPERKRSLSVGLILLIVIAAVALAGFGAYLLFPDALDKLTAGFHQRDNENKEIPVVTIVKPDTTKTLKTVADSSPKTKALVKPDTAQNAISADTVKISRWDIIAGTFRKQQTAANQVNYYKEIGVNATVLPDSSHRHFLVSAGSYPTRDEAEAARLKLVTAGKIGKTSYPLEIKPQK